MNRTTHRRALRASATATVCAALALSGAALALAPSATAAPGDSGAQKATLSVKAPAEIGFAAGPVEFTETIGNPGTTDVSETLKLVADAGQGVMSDSLAIDYRAADGSWKPVALTYAGGAFTGQPGEAFTVPHGSSTTVRLRIGLPMGTPHKGDTNGGTDHVDLTSAVGAAGASQPDAKDTHKIKVTSVTSAFVGLPGYAAPGGAPIEFGAKLTNPSPSRYTNLSYVLYADKYTSVQVLKGGKWTSLPAKPNPEGGYFAQGFYLVGPNSTVAPDSSATTRVRIAWRADAPVARAQLSGCVIVNERPGTPAFEGTTMCQELKWLNVTRAFETTAPAGPTATAAAPAAPSASASVSASASATPSATATSNAGAQLAHTGSGTGTNVAAVAGISLLLAGAATMASVRLRRRGH
ncbi:LPXTG cell wall anchor domain-containing protein [Streptomyces sp. NPDC049040]|uniref:LPXTG cell wall anchor domain-containing protein n=1 Tax=Streptomyces sp. NPDC049040 TaxID=3365593 RepID=UPI003716ACEF